MDIDGQKVRVDFSLTDRPHERTPGIYMGAPQVKHFPNSYLYGLILGNNKVLEVIIDHHVDIVVDHVHHVNIILTLSLYLSSIFQVGDLDLTQNKISLE
jgi:hypothetical protein